MPNAFELPRMLRPIVPLMRRERFAGFGRRVVNEFVAVAHRHALGSYRRPAAWRVPRLATIIGALNDLTEPRARLRRVESVRINRRPPDVINFPPTKVRSVHFPVFALPVRCQDERAFSCAYQYSYFAHCLNL